MPFIIIFIFIFACPINGYSENGNSQEVVAAVLRDWQPHYLTDSKTSKPAGFAIDMMNKVAELSGFEIRYAVYNDWPDAVEAVQKGQAVLLPNMGITAERQKLYDFTMPYETFRISAFVRQATSNIDKLSQLNEKKAGAVETNQGMTLLKNQGVSNIQAYKSPEELFMALVSGGIDVAVYPEQVFQGLAIRMGLDNKIKIIGQPLQEIKRGIAIRKGEPKLFQRLETAVQQLMKSPEYKTIYEKWHGKPKSFWNVKRVILLMGALFGLITAILLLWRYVSIIKLNKALDKTVTKLKETQEYLNESILRQKEAVKASNVGLWDWDLITNKVIFSIEWKKQIGYKDHEIDNDFKEWENRVHPDDLVPTLEKVKYSIANAQQNHQSEFRFLHKDGSYRWILTQGSVIQDTSGRSIRMLGSHIDITERKQDEKRLDNAIKYIQTILDNAPVGIATLRADGEIVTTNISLAKIIGGPIEGIVGRNIHEIESWRTSGMLAAAEDVLSSGLEKNLDFHYISSFDKECWVSSLFIPFTHENEQQLLLMMTDISKSKRAEGKNKKLQEQLQQAQKMESVGRLAGGVAHDYNNALTSIMGFTELAMMDADPKGPLHADLSQVLKSAKRAKDITRQLLAFARKQTIAPVVLDLNETVESMFKMLRRLIGEDIDLVWMPGKVLGNVKMDPSQIDQILANLCVNARDAIEGVGKITIETGKITFDEAYCADHTGFIPGEFVILAVSDNGCGMDKEILNNIFEPFFTTKPVDKGTGLGLSTVFGIVKQNNGFINVYSEPGKGTSVKIYLPLYEDEAVEIQRGSTGKIPQGQGETILLVEDDLSILKLAQKILERLNYTVLIAGTPKEGIKLAQDHTGEIYLLVTDVIMPEMNGLELSKQLKQFYPDLKCIFMSGYTANAIAHHGVLDEGVHFVQKPFAKKDLASIVRKVLDQ